MTTQRFVLGSVDWHDERDIATPYFLSNPHMYLVGSIGGVITAYGDEHLVGKMGGLWAHPMRIMHGWQVRIDGQVLTPATQCTVYPQYVERVHQHAGMRVVVQECLHPNLPLLSVQVQIHNDTDLQWQATVTIEIMVDVRGCWFGGIIDVDPHMRVFAHSVLIDRELVEWDGAVIARNSLDWRWQTTADSVYAQSAVTIAPRTAWHIDWVLAVDHEQQTVATALAKRWCGKHAMIVARDGLLLSPMAANPGVRLTTPDAAINDYWQVATHNMQQLVTQPHQMPVYFLAGIPEYPQVFGCDTAYAVPGLLAAGFGPATQSVIAYLAAHAHHACGRVPHEITTNGRIFHSGNAQETPQFTVACWQYMRWSGDTQQNFSLYALCVEGMQHVMGVLNGQHWPYGDGMVERHGMGAFKLDTVCYIYQALVALADWATTNRDFDDAQRWRTYATNLAARFEPAWWLAAESMYADSLQRDGTPQLDRHWTAIVPVQTQIATPARQQAVYQQVRRDLVNQWGLMHTKGADERVWTLPTGLLALSAFAQNDTNYGVELLHQIGSTARHGSLGLMKELIPQGICFVQLWSAALFVQGIVQGLCGIEPDMGNRQITITPRLPAEWPEVRLEQLIVANWVLDIVITFQQVTVYTPSDAEPLMVWVVSPDGSRHSQLVRGGFTAKWLIR